MPEDDSYSVPIARALKARSQASCLKRLRFVRSEHHKSDNVFEEKGGANCVVRRSNIIYSRGVG